MLLGRKAATARWRTTDYTNDTNRCEDAARNSDSVFYSARRIAMGMGRERQDLLRGPYRRRQEATSRQWVDEYFW